MFSPEVQILLTKTKTDIKHTKFIMTLLAPALFLNQENSKNGLRVKQ